MDTLGTNKRKKLTMDEHRHLATELHELYYKFMNLRSELYRRGYRNLSRIRKAENEIVILRSKMEDIMFFEHKGNPELSINIYYPGHDAIDTEISILRCNNEKQEEW